MADKEIIIDGVNVAGCDCYIREQLFPNNLEGGYYPQRHLCECGIQGCENYPFYCKDNPKCYYKQLKRLEQENKNLREAMHKDFCSHYVLGECSQEHHNNCVGRNQCIKDLEQENERLKEENFNWEQINKLQEKYQQVLAEIKEIAEEYHHNKPRLLCDMDNFVEQILQKISECEK